MKLNPKIPDLEQLADLHSFDPNVFWDSNAQVQRVCDLVLSMALIYNDFKDLWWAAYRLKRATPDFQNNFHETPAWGHVSGMDHHLHRRQVSILVEFRTLLDANRRTIESKFFQDILKKLQKHPQVEWEQLRNPDSDLWRNLENIRDKISFHYYSTDREGRKVLQDGFRAAFENTGRKPLLSYGEDMLHTRFYFADAAAVEMDKLSRPIDWRKKLDEHTQQVSLVISGVILTFFEIRGAKLIKHKEASN